MPHSAALEVVDDAVAPQRHVADVPPPPAVDAHPPATQRPRPTDASPAPSVDRSTAVPGPVSDRLKAARIRRGLSVRGLAREVGVSPSLVSQIENGKANPSVGTLYAIVSALDISLDELFDRGERPSVDGPPLEPPPLPSTLPTSAVVRADERSSLQLDSGVTWDRLTPEGDEAVDFLQVTYSVGAASCPPDALLRHNGREYGLVLSGRLGATVGFSSYELGPGDSIAIDSATPHRLWTIGDEPARVIWTVVGRGGSLTGDPG